MARILKLGLVILVMITGLAFHLRNDHPVELDFYLGVLDFPLSLYIIAALCVGAVFGILAALPRLLRLRRENHRLRRQISNHEKELNNLRVTPIRDDR